MDDTPEPRPRSPKAEPTSGPTEAELSRIAREAVHQAPDSRLDKQLARMGLLGHSSARLPFAEMKRSGVETVVWGQIRDGRPGQGDLLPCLDALDEAREVRLRGVDVHLLRHARSVRS